MSHGRLRSGRSQSKRLTANSKSRTFNPCTPGNWQDVPGDPRTTPTGDRWERSAYRSRQLLICVATDFSSSNCSQSGWESGLVEMNVLRSNSVRKRWRSPQTQARNKDCAWRTAREGERDSVSCITTSLSAKRAYFPVLFSPFSVEIFLYVTDVYKRWGR